MKKVLVLITGLVALLLIAALGFILTLDPNDHKTFIEDKFQASTGLDLNLGGELGLTLYPWLGITANNVSISNPPGFSTEPLLSTEHAQLRIKLLPLLGGSYEIDTVRLQGTQVQLEVLSDGSSNWTALAGGDDTTPETTDEGSGSATAILNKVIIGGVDISNFGLVYDDQFANTHYEITDLNMSIGELVYGAPLDINLALGFASRSPELGGDLTLTGTVLYDVDAGRYDLDPLQLQATLRGANIPGGSTDLNLTTALHSDLDANTLSLPNLQLDVLDTQLQAALDIARVQSETPALTGSLMLTGQDLAVLLRVLEQNALADSLGNLDRGFDIETNLDLDLGSGTLNIPTLQAALLGASIDGQINATRINTETPQVSGQLNAQGPDLPLLLQIAGQLQGSDSPLATMGQQLRDGVSNRGFTLATAFDADLQSGNISLPTLEAEMLGFRLDGQLTANGMSGNDGTLDGNLALTGSNLEEVLTALDQGDLAAVAQSLQLNLQASGSSNNLRLSPVSLELILAGAQIPNSPQTLALNADTLLNLAQDSLQIDSFSLAGLGLDLNGNVTARNISTAPTFEGQLELPAFNARRLLEQLNQPAPVTSDDTVLQNVALSTAFQGTSNSLALNELAVTLDDSQLSGSLAMEDFSTRAARFSLNLDALDADRYLPPPSDEEAVATDGSDNAPLPLDTLRALDIDGSLNIGELHISGLAMQDIELTVLANAGNLALNPVSAQLYDGSFAGDIRLDATGDTPTASLNTTLTTINLEPLLQDFMDATYLTGNGTIELALNGRGADAAALMSSLSGNGSLVLADGVLSGIDVGAVLQSVETMIRSRSVGTLPQGGTTPFENFSATLAVNQGVVGSEDLLIQAPGWRIVGAGTLVDLNNDSIAFDLVAAVDESTATRGEEEYDLGGYTLPIACTGAITDPRCLPDAQQIIAGAVGNAVQRRLGEFLQERLGDGQQPAQGDGTTPQEQLQDGTTPTTEDNQQQPDQTPGEQLLNQALDRLLR